MLQTFIRLSPPIIPFVYPGAVGIESVAAKLNEVISRLNSITEHAIAVADTPNPAGGR